jgi:xanthine dehydrogenase accessory factor
VYEIALSVAACLRAGTQVDIAWIVETRGFSSQDLTEALAITPGGGRVGSLMSGALNEQLADLVSSGASGRLVEIHVGEIDAMAAGLACGGTARCLLLPGTDLPPQLWQLLRDREPVGLVARLDAGRVTDTAVFTRDTVTEADGEVAQLLGRGVSRTSVSDTIVTTVLWPVPQLVLIGTGGIIEALQANAALLGWHTHVFADVSSATGAIAGLSLLDKVVVVSHDVELAGPALAAALDSDVGYIGAVGSRDTQRVRAQWLAYRDITDLTRIHGPAGLDIGARTPAEIAVSIVAEALADASGSTAVALRSGSGPIHQSGALATGQA